MDGRVSFLIWCFWGGSSLFGRPGSGQALITLWPRAGHAPATLWPRSGHALPRSGHGPTFNSSRPRLPSSPGWHLLSRERRVGAAEKSNHLLGAHKTKQQEQGHQGTGLPLRRLRDTRRAQLYQGGIGARVGAWVRVGTGQRAIWSSLPPSPSSSRPPHPSPWLNRPPAEIPLL